jgi:alkylation response protein AidB-like acyl-CoA dehydrogenase
MSFSSTAEQDRLYAEARDFAGRRVAAAAGGRVGRPYFGNQEWLLCGELGLLGACVPEPYGGRGHDALTVARIVEGFARGCSDTGLVFSACAHLFACAMPIAEHADDALKERVLPRLASGEWVGANAITEAEAGSDVFSLSTRAVRDGARYRLTGRKTFVTNGPVADCFLIYASTEPEHGYLGITAFVVEEGAPGLTRGEHFDKIGLSGAPVCDVTLEDCPVDESNRVGAEGAGAAIFRSSMDWERACLFAQYLGVMDRQLDEVLAFAKRRRQFGKALGRHQAVAHRIADMKLRLDAGRLLLHRSCWM